MLFLITGVSSGLGRAFAHAALDAGRSPVENDLREWEELSRSTDYPDGHQIAPS